MARGNKDIAKNGEKTRFSKDRQPKKSGRKKKLYTILKAKEPRLTRGEFNDNRLAMLMGTQEDFDKIAQDKDAPMYIRITAMAIQDDMENGRSTTLQQIIEDNFGKAEQKISTEVSFTDFLKKASAAHGIKTDDE